MIADVETAALKATETLIKFQITTAPIDPLLILKKLSNVIVVSFSEIAERVMRDRKELVTMFGDQNQDAGTVVTNDHGKLRYLVVYNQRLPFALVQRALARELGHIIMGHDGSRPDEVRTEEAWYFARYLLCPRPLLKTIKDAGIPLTTEIVGNVTGCYERCLAGLRKTPGAHVPPELNRLVKDQFADYLSNFLDYQQILKNNDESPLADFGMYLDNYEE